MTTLSPAKRTVAAAVVLAMALFALVASNRAGDHYTVTAEFAKTPGLYVGNQVVVLGVEVGSITAVEPHGTSVAVTMEISNDVPLPADVTAILLPQSVVTDRVVELSPYYTSGPKLSDGGSISTDHTRTPVEFQDVIEAVNELTRELGRVEHRTGAIDDFMNVAADNARGNGAPLRDTLQGVQAALAGFTANRGDTEVLIRQLSRLTRVMATSDDTIRRFSGSVTAATEILAGDGRNINAGLRELLTALRDVAGFVQGNRAELRSGIRGLAGAAGTFGDRAAEMAEIVDLLPLLMQNVLRTIDPKFGVRIRGQAVNSILNGGLLEGYCAAVTRLPICSELGLRQAGPDLGLTELLTGSTP